MEKRPCGFRGCKTLTRVDERHDIPTLSAYVTTWCNKHAKQYRKEQEKLDVLVPEYNQKQLKDKFGRIIRFSHGTDVSNYLFKNDKKELDRILKTVSS